MKDFEELAQEFSKADRQRQIAELRAEDAAFPDDPTQWLKGLEKNLAAAEDRLPADVWEEFSELITRQIRIARKQITIADGDGLRLSLQTLHDNWERLTSNIDRAGINQRRREKVKFKEGGRTGGKVPKRRVWAECMAKILAEETECASDDDAWGFLAGCTIPFTIDVGADEYEVYIDGSSIVAANTLTSKESTLAKSSFLKQYYRSARSTGK